MLPGALGLIGTTGAGLALAPALRVLTYPLLGLTVVTLAWGWHRTARHHGSGALARKATAVLALSTVAAIALWTYRIVWIG